MINKTESYDYIISGNASDGYRYSTKNGMWCNTMNLSGGSVYPMKDGGFLVLAVYSNLPKIPQGIEIKDKSVSSRTTFSSKNSTNQFKELISLLCNKKNVEISKDITINSNMLIDITCEDYSNNELEFTDFLNYCNLLVSGSYERVNFTGEVEKPNIYYDKMKLKDEKIEIRDFNMIEDFFDKYSLFKEKYIQNKYLFVYYIRANELEIFYNSTEIIKVGEEYIRRFAIIESEAKSMWKNRHMFKGLEGFLLSKGIDSKKKWKHQKEKGVIELIYIYIEYLGFGMLLKAHVQCSARQVEINTFINHMYKIRNEIIGHLGDLEKYKEVIHPCTLILRELNDIIIFKQYLNLTVHFKRNEDSILVIPYYFEDGMGWNNIIE